MPGMRTSRGKIRPWHVALVTITLGLLVPIPPVRIFFGIICVIVYIYLMILSLISGEWPWEW